MIHRLSTFFITPPPTFSCFHVHSNQIMIAFATKLRRMSIQEWVQKLVINGRPSFTFEEVTNAFPSLPLQHIVMTYTDYEGVK